MFQLQKVKARFVSVTPLAEKHGQKRSPACSIGVEVVRNNLILDEFDKGLRTAFYEKADAAAQKKPQGELDVSDEDLDGLTALKFPWFGQSIKHDQVFSGYSLVLHVGISEKSWITLDSTKVDNFDFALKEGGSVAMKFRVLAHPNDREQGKIDHLLQQDVTISLLAPLTEETLFDKSPDTTPAGAAPEPADDDPLAGSDLARDA